MVEGGGWWRWWGAGGKGGSFFAADRTMSEELLILLHTAGVKLYTAFLVVLLQKLHFINPEHKYSHYLILYNMDLETLKYIVRGSFDQRLIQQRVTGVFSSLLHGTKAH